MRLSLLYLHVAEKAPEHLKWEHVLTKRFGIEVAVPNLGKTCADRLVQVGFCFQRCLHFLLIVDVPASPCWSSSRFFGRVASFGKL